MKDDRHVEKIELLERKISQLNEEIKAEKNRGRKAKPLPYEKYQKCRTHSKLSGHNSKTSNYAGSERSCRSKKRKVLSPYPKQQNEDMEIDQPLKLRKSTSRKRRRNRENKAPQFIPLRGPQN